MAKNFSKVEAKNYTFARSLLQYFIIYFILYPYFKIFYNVKVYGRENIPKDGSLIVASNHSSHFDPVLMCLATRYPVAFMAKEELFHVPVLSQLIQALGAFSVNREKMEISTIKSAKAVLSTKWFLGIFPEGTRVQGKIGDIKPGFGYLAKATKAQILPMSIMGLKERKLVIKIGQPIPAPSTPEEAVEKWGTVMSELTGYEFNPEKQEEMV